MSWLLSMKDRELIGKAREADTAQCPICGAPAEIRRKRWRCRRVNRPVAGHCGAEGVTIEHGGVLTLAVTSKPNREEQDK
jgi:ribosomal protein L37AE/L43A